VAADRLDSAYYGVIFVANVKELLLQRIGGFMPPGILKVWFYTSKYSYNSLVDALGKSRGIARYFGCLRTGATAEDIRRQSAGI